MNSKESGNATNGQFVEILTIITRALVTVLTKYDAKELINRLKKSGGELTLNLARVFDAMLNYEIITSVPRQFDVWTSLSLDDEAVDNYFKYLQSRNYSMVGDYVIAHEGINERPFTGWGKVDFVKVKVSDLGFEHIPTFGEVFHRARHFKLFYIEPTFVPQLRNFYQDQPVDEILIVAMSASNNPRMRPSVFTLENRSDLGLSVGTYVTSSDDHDQFKDDIKLNLNDLVVFAQK